MLRRLIIFCFLSIISVGTMMALQQSDVTKSKASNSTMQQRDTMNKQKDKKMQDMHHDQMSATMLSSDDKEFVMKAAEGGNAEVELGQLAVSKASNADVKQFAQRMVDDHGKANTELMQLAQNKGITLPTSTSMSSTTDPDTTAAATTQSDKMKAKDHKMMTDQQKTMDKLSKLSGADFDKAYMSDMVKDHEKDVAMFEKEASKGKDTDVKAWAAAKLPTLKEHLQMARDTAAKVNAKGTTPSSATNMKTTKKP